MLLAKMNVITEIANELSNPQHLLLPKLIHTLFPSPHSQEETNKMAIVSTGDQ